MPETEPLPTSAWERFVHLYGTPETVARLWEQWMAAE